MFSGGVLSKLKCCVLGVVALHFGSAHAADASRAWFDAVVPGATHLLEIKLTVEHAKRLEQFRGGGFEAAQGTWVSFRPWYSSTGRDISVSWMTQIQPGFGVIWGASTGERGVKYAIAPGLKLGAVYQTEISKDGFLTFRGTTIVGGSLKEKSCMAQYGEVGGTQEVNCRLAASEQAPLETLKYLARDKPHNQHQLLIQFTKRF